MSAAAEALARDYGRLLLWLAGLLLLLSGCYWLATLLARPVAVGGAAAPTQATPTPTPVPTPVPTSATTPAPGGVVASPTVSPEARPTATAAPSPTPARADAPELTPGRRSVTLAAVPVLLVALTVLWVGFWVLTRRPGLVVKDSPRFLKALEVWHPLVFAKSSTPRSVKRFMNRVRYLAMRQRRQSDSPPAWRRLLDRPFPAGAGGAGTSKTGGGATPIPDEMLVALAAIEHFKPRWLKSDAALTLTGTLREARSFGVDIAAAEEGEWELFRRAKLSHAGTEEFEGWDAASVIKARKQFLGQSEDVQVN